MVIKQIIFPKHTHCTMYNENLNMLELRIKMLHFLVILTLMQFYVLQFNLFQVFYDEVYYLIL